MRSNSSSRSAGAQAFRNVARQAGIIFRLDNGARGNHLFIETTTGGCAFLDYNNDGYLDVFLIQAGPEPTVENSNRSTPRPPCALYRNNGDGTFKDVTREAGLNFDQGYAQGIAVADFDNDGWPDLYITAYGGNHLLRNVRGRFEDVTERATVADTAHGPRWSTAAAWADFDNDGRLDLFVCHYAHWTPQADIPCRNPRETRSYCTPDFYPGETPTLFHNNGDGTFTDVTQKAGLAGLRGRSLGVCTLDYDGDGREDIFVANDLMPNYLLHNLGKGRFVNTADQLGVSVMDTGLPLAGMGVGIGDYDNDGREDLLITNFSNQPKVVFRNREGSRFENTTYSSGIGTTTQLVLGWGCELVDYDLDGYKDAIIGNGHVNDDVEMYSKGITYKEPKQLFHNQRDATFVEDPIHLGDLAEPSVTRGLAIGDFDNDGRPDILANNHNMDAQLFRNEIQNRNAWITFRFEGTKSNRDGLGAKVWVTCGKLGQYAEVRSGSSYASHSDQRVTFGLGPADRIDSIRVRWPSGIEDAVRSLPSRKFYLCTEGKGTKIDPRVKPFSGSSLSANRLDKQVSIE